MALSHRFGKVDLLTSNPLPPMNITSVPELKKLLRARFSKSAEDNAVIDGVCDDVRIPVKTVHSGRFYSVHLGRSKEGHFQERSNVGVHGVLGGSDSVKRLKSGASFPSVARFSFGSNLLPPRRGVIHRLSPTENGHVPARRRAVSGCG